MPFSSHSKLLSKLMPSHLIEKFNRDLAEIGEISAKLAVKKQYFYRLKLKLTYMKSEVNIK